MENYNDNSNNFIKYNELSNKTIDLNFYQQIELSYRYMKLKEKQIEFCKMQIAHLQKNKPYWFQTKDLHGYQEDIELIEEQICEYYRLINNEVKLIDKIRDKILKENS